jgi:AAHS family 4-hydroxybenzoate transporter-like MFS transporter
MDRRRPRRAIRVTDGAAIQGQWTVIEPRQTTIAAVIDRMPLGAYRIRIVVMCFLIVLMDGFDTQAIGFAATEMASSLAIPITAFGPVFSAGLLGAMLGALVLGPLGDRFGRRWVLVGSVLTFSSFSLLTPHAPDFSALLGIRFCAGLGLGGAIPNLLSLSSEYAPSRIRGLLTGLLWAGFPLGGAIAAVTSTYLLPLFGWPALFYVGGSIPLLLAAVVAWALPESLQFLVQQPNGQREVATIVRRIALELQNGQAFHTDTEGQLRHLPFMHLFSDGRTASTLLLWIAYFMCFVLLIVLVLWTPALLRQAGVDKSQAALIVGLANLGSVAGCALGGQLVGRLKPYVILPLLFIAAAFSVGALGYIRDSVVLLGLFAALSGLLLGAGASGLLSVAVFIYPSAMRATGVGWAMALGRMGQVTGPLVIGSLMADGLAISSIFLCCAIPALCAGSAAAMERIS